MPISTNPRPIRVAALIWQGKSWMGGWYYYLNMARILKEHSTLAQFMLFLPNGTDAASRDEAEEASGHPCGVLPDVSTLEDIRRLFSGHNKALTRALQAHDINLVIEQARFLGRSFPIPIISWIADLQHRRYPEFFSLTQRVKRDVGFWAQLTFRRHVYVSSESARIDTFSFISRPNATVHAVPFTVIPTVDVTSTAIDDIKKKYGITTPYYIVPNQLWPHKNHVTAIRAMSFLSSEGYKRTIAFTGTPELAKQSHLAAEIMREINEVGPNANIIWLGKIPYPELQHLIAGSEALVNPSKFEGWSTIVEEAKSLGTPMILSDLDVHREQAGTYARFFAADDHVALGRLLCATGTSSDEPLSARLQRASVINANAQQAYAERLEDLFGKAIASL